jgi:predicted PurR-regulated permease PerM
MQSNPLPTDRTTQRLIRALLIAGLAVAVGALIGMIASVFDRIHTTLVEIVFAILFAYAIYPPVQWLASKRVPVPLAAIAVYAVLGVLVLGALAWLAPAIASQVEAFGREYPHLVAQTQRQIADPTHSPLLSRRRRARGRPSPRTPEKPAPSWAASPPGSEPTRSSS